ncbi:cytochrome c oxidase accessory protein CcoG [Parvularcula sp. IMCC14364]|uniref:cytochrome c oxidase accessory protein CcoG n=1 Tax=Parvularcula sp. IMCC14364 TaxID=3067902 RepID=UPI0027411578|nr:cytochrome c oxidase accessory protein CcoG [Parvularcula sp. IMCC14364]
MSQSGIQQYDVSAVNSTQRRELYKKREAVYPKLVHGKYRFIKWVLLFVTLGIYYGLPWVRWPRGPSEPDQAVLVDFTGQRFYFFFIEIWPDELYFVTGLLVLSALLLFLVTAVFGRLWCGYACPQTVWTDLFIAVERLIEGDRNKRIALDKQKWGVSKIFKKTSKHTLWLLIAAATGGAWVLYFHDAPTVIGNLFTGQAPMSAYLFLGILTFTTYTLAGIMREQVCTYMCPWPRIQAAMTDSETFSVGYYHARGEPRGKHKKGQSWEARGDCIDCKACVVACPMGIDIREGDQLECINCGLCIDACDDIMRKVNRPTGLIGYGSTYRSTVHSEKKRIFPKLFRSRTVFYSTVILIISAVMLFGLTNRATMEFTIERNRAPAFTVLSDGSIRNALTVRILNKVSEEVSFSLAFTGPDALVVDAVGYTPEDGALALRIPGDQLQNTRVFLTLPNSEVEGNQIKATLVNNRTGETTEKLLSLIGKG